MTDLWLHKHQINEQHHKVMLDVFVCKSLAARALRQPDIPASASVLAFEFAFRNILCRWSSSLGVRSTCEVRYGGLRGGRSALVVATMKDVVELGDRVAALDANWHSALASCVAWRWCGGKQRAGLARFQRLELVPRSCTRLRIRAFCILGLVLLVSGLNLGVLIHMSDLAMNPASSSTICNIFLIWGQ